MTNQKDRLAIARIDGAGGVHASLIKELLDGNTQAALRIGQDADAIIRNLRLEVAALKERLDVARTVRR